MEKRGLSSCDVQERIKQYGLNEVKSKKESTVKKIALKVLSPISLMLLAASLISLFINNPFDFYFISALFFINFGIQFWQENKADMAIESLKSTLSVKSKVLRDEGWKMIDSKEIVPGDIIELVVGDLIPADIRIIESRNLSVNESVLTGESLPKDKKENDTVYSGSFISTGVLTGEVMSTGANTSFSKEILSIEKPKRKSVLEKDVLTISKFLIVMSFICIAILTSVFLIDKKPIGELLILDLSLLIAGIPVALPVVMSLIISLGVLGLSRKNVIVRRLSSLEDLSNVKILLTDKTGTMTKNQIDIEEVIAYGKYKGDEVLSCISSMVFKDNKNTINQAIIRKFNDTIKGRTKPDLVDFIPADSERKRAFSVVNWKGKTISVSMGAPQVISKLCRIDGKTSKKFEKDIEIAASKGYRTLAVSIKEGKDENKMGLAGILLLSDPPLPEAKQVIEFLKENDIEVKMLTGDNELIAERVSEQIGLKGIIIKKESLKNLDKEKLEKAAVFAEILPKDKYNIVKAYQEEHIVAVTGDGINDLPAMETANVSIAVHNAADALKSSADIVLLSNGIDVIKDAVIESRKIFSRLYAYSVYRLSESFRLIISILILGIIIADFPLTPLQLILLAFMNDLPVLSLAFNRVKLENKVRKIDTKGRFVLSSLFGTVGIFNSILLYLIASKFLHLSIATIQTMYFLKLTVSGHMLIFVAHTKEKWYKFFPSRQVIIATVSTQLIATAFAFTGLFMSSKLSLGLIALVWVWAFFWMQISEYMKTVQQWIVEKG